MTSDAGLRPVLRSVLRVLLACALALALDVPAPAAEGAPAPFADTVRLRGRLDNARLAFTQRQAGHVAFIGGSITEMDGYRPMVATLLRERFFGTAFTITDAGIASTCSTTGAFRLGRDVLSKGPLDLFFIEFAVNDDQDAHHDRTACIRGLEGIIRQVRAAHPAVDIVLTFFVNEGMVATIQAGQVPLSIAAHLEVAEHYGISTIDLARQVTAQIGDGTLTWKEFGGVHPAPTGNALCTRMIDELLRRAWSAPSPAGAAPVAHPLPEPLDPLNYQSARFVDPAQAVVLSGWTLGVPDWKQLPGGKRERFTAIPMLCASEPGAEASLRFSGTAVGAYVVAGPDAGMVEASIDGGAFRAVDLYHDFSKGLHYPRTVLFASDLAPGAHTLVLRISARSTSGGHAARIMQFAVN